MSAGKHVALDRVFLLSKNYYTHSIQSMSRVYSFRLSVCLFIHMYVHICQSIS